jgi:hypothetical protein
MEQYIFLKQRDIMKEGDEYQISVGVKIFLPVPAEYYGKLRGKFVNYMCKVRRPLE